MPLYWYGLVSAETAAQLYAERGLGEPDVVYMLKGEAWIAVPRAEVEAWRATLSK